MRTLRPLGLLLALSCALPSVSHAQLNLAWNNCITQPSAAENVQYACNSTANGTVNLVPSFIVPHDLPAFVGTDMVLTISTDNGPLPDFWDFAVDGCREGSLYFPAYENGTGTGKTGACQNPWTGTGGGAYHFDFNYNGSGATRIRTIRAIINARPLAAGQEYHAGVFTLDFLYSAENEQQPFCAGCCQTVTITLVQIDVDQIAESPGGDVITLTTPATRNFVTWNALGCNGNSSIPTPTRQVSWGRIKATYR